ncbi:NAD(P)H-dependent oxidoreductase [Thermovenabulum gondwanense]|uniref:Uncharacterized protein n=1 Tax=Thermovenabulum gondwanense TaxID=520767 RepID=A0A161PTQ1_9FIRM|nr:SAF domain-containing protein [Thermovenabulum gondwanense]KYO65264.1 hypothetical protein ATZ99_17130 [Thermovenabulum gondwanense]
MLNLKQKLLKLEEEGKKIRVGIVGAGQMGRGLVSQLCFLKGMVASCVCDHDLNEARLAYILAGVKEEDIKFASNEKELDSIVNRGYFAITDDYTHITGSNSIDVVVDATGVTEAGANIAFNSINNGKHVVMLNVETDVTVGAILKKMADRADVVYTVSAGDEPGAIKELYDFADAMGFEIIAAGKGKNNPLNRDATPGDMDIIKKAEKFNMNPKMLTSFVDGTKTMVELTAVSNATGLLPTKRGLIGPEGKVEDLPDIFSLKEQGGILEKTGVVEFVKGIAPGVFVVVSTGSKIIKEELEYLSMGKGPNYVFYRPYHLTSLETPISIARAYFYKEPTIAPRGKPVSETITVAKKDLKKGERLDGIGGYTIYGLIDTCENAKKERALPIGLVNKNTVLKKDVKKGSVITYDDVELDENSTILNLRRLQEKIFK